MPLFRRGGGSGDDVREAQAQQAASVDALVAGGLPSRATERLSQPGTCFTSDLSVAEFALTARAGVRPVALVTGSSVYHVGWQSMPGSWLAQAVSQELDVLSHAWNEARRLAFSRLQQEAELAGAHAVVGLDQTVGAHDWMSGSIEYMTFGTAVREDGDATGTVLTNLSMQDYTQLRSAGYRPVGLFGSSGIFYIVSGWGQQRAQMGWGSWANQELKDFTRGIYDARELVLRRVTTQAQKVGADGLVGMWLSYGIEEREVEQRGMSRIDLIVTMHALGTAIVKDSDATPPAPRLAVDLSAGRDRDHILGGAE
ncbi:MAG TPA: heavy metal-binding domain-containing protein [Gaiellaceae bacterium]|nr:heavy metal-binding domain-containing protein [Gaiellaceae bacterium]